MSFVADQVHSLDLQLDRLHFEGVSHQYEVASQHSAAGTLPDAVPPQSSRTLRLQKAIAALSVTKHNTTKSSVVLRHLREAGLTPPPAEWESVEAEAAGSEDDAFERELEWVLVGKAAVQTYGILLDILVSQTVPLSEDLFYWDEVLSSHRYTALYSLQTAPRRLWELGWEVYEDALQRLRELRIRESLAQTMDSGDGDGDDEEEDVEADGISRKRSARQQHQQQQQTESFSESLKKFFGMVQSSLRERSLLELNKRSISPFAAIRHDIKSKQANIRKLKEMQASGLGVLVNEGLSFESEEEQDDWKGVLERGIILMENVALNVTHVDQTIEQFEDAVFAGPTVSAHDLDDKSNGPKEREDGSELTVDTTEASVKKYATSTPCGLSLKLQDILSRGLPAQLSASQRITSLHGKPGIITRYWIPATAILLSSGAILRILVRRKAAIKAWIKDLGTTIYDFWINWVVEPGRKIVGTIRHDKDSEVALMSRRSLVADMDSLERMVVEFAVDNPATSAPDTNDTSISKLTDAQVDIVRERVKEGDLTPVLKVYEKELKSPVRSAIRGELVRALLIQIQKTKVDVEVAVSGIDNILKSQELVFGFVGLTPGVLVCVATFRWLRGIWGGRKGIRSGKVKGEMLRTLRNIDRILATSQANHVVSSPTSPDPNAGLLTFKEHGLLLCEVHTLRSMARNVMPHSIMAEFVEDMNDLSNIKNGVQAQSRAVERVKWAYSRWIH